MPHLLSLAKIIQSLFEEGSVVPARLRDRMDEATAQAVERALRALSEVAMQQHHQARAAGTYTHIREEHDLLLAEIASRIASWVRATTSSISRGRSSSWRCPARWRRRLQRRSRSSAPWKRST